jgi:sugar diacid utilization regulator
MAQHSSPATARDPVVPDDATQLGNLFEEIAQRACRSPEPFGDTDFDDIRAAGARAAEQGATAGETVDLYLTSVARAWSTLTSSISSAQGSSRLLDLIRTAVPLLVQGYENAGQHLIRQEETARREFIDDLLRGDADIAGIVQRAEPFGLDLRASHQVVLVGPRGEESVDERDQSILDRAVVSRFGDRDVLVTTKGHHLVALVPADSSTTDVDGPARLLHSDLSRSSSVKSWRIAIGRPYPGAYGVARSYQQAREAITLAERLHPDLDMVRTRDLLIYRVLGRDRAALADLVESVLTPLTRARGGAEPLVDTLEAYFAAGEVSTETARRLHVSVRTVTYRLAKISDLTGYDPTVPAQRLTLQAAVVGARLLPWPETGRTT